MMEKVKQFVNEHPQWTSWIVLAIGMVAILVWSARDVGLLPGQWVALIVATILVAGLAVWIIGWEDEEEIEASGETTQPASESAEAAETS
jgi:MFS superfamily sulfate permease-like transporter